MTFDTPVGQYRWIENWITIPDSPLGRANGRTHGVAVLKDGQVVIFHQADPAVLFYSPQGELLKSWGSYPGAHGLTVVEEDGQEFLWLVDESTKQAVKTDLDGHVLLSLTQPPHPAYTEGGGYTPTWLAVAEERFGGNGDLWLADGYGSSLVHRFDKTGKYLSTLDGTEGAGRFNCPHGLALDTRRATSEFYIADRGNSRFQVYSLDGQYRRIVTVEHSQNPDISAQLGNHLVVPDLVAGLTILDAQDLPVASLGFNSQVAGLEGWPNDRRWISEGLFNSPHSATTDPLGNIYIVEWITCGRVIKLERLN